MINNVDAVFGQSFVFRDRFSGADDFFKPKDDIEPDPVRGLAMRRTNFIPDIVNCDLPLDNRRSPGWRRVEPFMTNNCFYFWIGQHEQAATRRAHAHTSAAVLICGEGQGLYLHLARGLGVTPWKDGRADEVKRRRLRAGRHGERGARRRALVPPALRRVEGSIPPHRLVWPPQPGPRPGRPRREGDRLYRHGHPRGRHVDPYWMEDPYIRAEIRGDSEEERGSQPHGSRVVTFLLRPSPRSRTTVHVFILSEAKDLRRPRFAPQEIPRPSASG